MSAAALPVADVQRLLAAAGYYKGPVDGSAASIGAAVEKLLVKHRALATSDPAKWPEQRRRTAAGQIVLHFAAFNVGAIDGMAGNQTNGAFLEWNHFVTTGKKLVLDRTPIAPAIKTKFPRQADCPTFYGKPGEGSKGTIEAQLVNVDLPFPFRIDYALNQTRKTLRLHKKCADSAAKAIAEIVQHYGEAEMRRLGLDRFAGDYVPRPMRGGKSWSMHAYGCAIDFYAGRNGLTMRCPEALFCGADYRAFFDIWEKFGWLALGRAIGRDWMHVQAAAL